MRYAQACLAWYESNPCEDWDLAFAHAAVSHAAAVIGDSTLHENHYTIAQTLGHAIKDEEDRKVFMNEFARLPLLPRLV